MDIAAIANIAASSENSLQPAQAQQMQAQSAPGAQSPEGQMFAGEVSLARADVAPPQATSDAAGANLSGVNVAAQEPVVNPGNTTFLSGDRILTGLRNEAHRLLEKGKAVGSIGAEKADASGTVRLDGSAASRSSGASAHRQDMPLEDNVKRLAGMLEYTANVILISQMIKSTTGAVNSLTKMQ